MGRLLRGLVAATALLIFATTLPVSAQNSAGQKGASGLSISPTRVELSLKPGEADKVDITLKNITNDDVVARAFVNDFESDNDTGNPRIIVDTSKKSANSIRDFVSGLDDISLAKGEQKKITVFVQLPKTLAPGGYYGLIRFMAVPKGAAGEKTGEVALSASVSTLVLIEVPGAIKEQVQFNKLRVYQGNNSGVVFTKKPNEVGVELKNLGNSFAKPFGKVVVKDMSGKEVYSYELNNSTPRSNILPGSTRTFKDPIKNIGGPGRYTVLASVSYGKGSDVLVYKKAFWYVPVWLMIVITAVIALIVLGIYMLYRKYRRGATHLTKTSKK